MLTKQVVTHSCKCKTCLFVILGTYVMLNFAQLLKPTLKPTENAGAKLQRDEKRIRDSKHDI